MCTSTLQHPRTFSVNEEEAIEILSKHGEIAIFKRLAVFPLIKLIELPVSINADNSVSAI